MPMTPFRNVMRYLRISGCTALCVLSLFSFFPRNAFATQSPFDIISGDQLWILDALAHLDNQGVFPGYEGSLQRWEEPPARDLAASRLARALVVADVQGATTENAILIWMLTEEFREELETLGINVANLDRQLALRLHKPNFRTSDELLFGNKVNASAYVPFRRGNLLRPLKEKPTLTIASAYPRLDGATSAWPVYGAAAEMVYRGLNAETALRFIQYSTTPDAYENLICGSADVFFGLQPSQQQLDRAKSKRVKLTLTPIAKEAFVFFVHRNNPVHTLTVKQIQDIYQKKIVSWDIVGGTGETIMPLQRSANSGSQTIMLARVMRNKPPAPPLQDEFIRTMGGMIRRVVTVRTNPAAIGYTFRYYVTEMDSSENVKLLAVNGIAPTPENIRSGKYPFIVNIYAVTRGQPTGNIKKLIDWLRSEQGQRLVENVGYIGF